MLEFEIFLCGLGDVMVVDFSLIATSLQFAALLLKYEVNH